VPIKEEIGAGVTVLGVGIRKDGSSGIEQWRFTQASMAHRHDPVPIVYSVLERGDEDSCMINYLTKSKDLEKNIQAAFSYAAEKHPGRINANVVIRSMSEKFKSRWLNSSSAPTP